MITIKNVLVATDFSEPSEAAVRYGLAFARTFSATLHLVNVADDLAAHAAMSAAPVMDFGRLQTELEDDARERLAALIDDDDRAKFHAHLVVLTSTTPATAILGYAEDAAIDLIIIGTHGRTGLSHFFMGSVAQKVVRAAHCPVLTVRENEREFLQPDALVAIAHQPVK